MRFTTYTDYSLRVLMYLARSSNETTTITELSDFFKISRNHLVKIVHHLGLIGYIKTTRGRSGGIRLAKLAKDIKLGDVVNQTEPDSNLLECLTPNASSCVIDKQCRLKGILATAQREFIEGLNKYSLQQFATPTGKTKDLFKSVMIHSK
ncbi:Rrf2 family transcriptional regulator [Polynucleobacter sp. MWH-Braz-FAM2G]|uniref:Rrf2 family transcriptional regulator n=1 Tax=Polynucleobacter sp. MWH-Braz-FAM2G TaxID=1855883 RepID=UPI001BFE3D56|nr:Rrf2 family transcriptional regulator [Polynucleobacter sp. MWH-Braz-FAM2G]QWD90222.1 Rrf2 family transcriptional regulator [Polynucleobacter sp. MWH-Braz-FAM2G]